jgi:glyoxylase-like metal-dependent hydrolase (beta-lactamase superfamily II)
VLSSIWHIIAHHPYRGEDNVSEAPPSLPAPDVDPANITEIDEGVWVIPDRRVPLVPNVGIVEGDGAVLVVDSGMGPRNGARVLAAAQEKANGRPIILTTTHFHPEHGFGAQAFEGVKSIYNRAQLDELHDKGPAYLEMFKTFGPAIAEALEGVELTDPEETYDGDSFTLDLGGRTVQLLTWGLAHTRGDQVVFLPEERILFTGDLVEERIFPIYPYFPPDDADVDGSAWIDVLRKLEELEPRLVVPGHGDVTDAAVIAVAREYHEALREETFRLADEGVGADDAVARLEPAFHARFEGWEQPEWVAFGIRCFHAARG